MSSKRTKKKTKKKKIENLYFINFCGDRNCIRPEHNEAFTYTEKQDEDFLKTLLRLDEICSYYFDTLEQKEANPSIKQAFKEKIVAALGPFTVASDYIAYTGGLDEKNQPNPNPK